MDESRVKFAYNYGTMLGKELARMSDLVVVGESIPGGTTTTLAVLTALGIDAKFKVSSSMPANPHSLKNKVVESAMERANVGFGGISSAFKAVSLFGDPMMPSVAGIAEGAITAGGKVMLAGGTQMSAVVAILKSLGAPLKRLCIGTTSYVAQDRSSDLTGLASRVSRDVPVLSCDLHLGNSRKPGLQAYAKGFVKDGVGAGGASIAAMLKSKGRITGRSLMKAIQREYEISIETSKKEQG
jgi:uncharacterized protein (TIGR00303 family)